MGDKHTIANLQIKPVIGWLNVTDDIEDAPFTLAREDGVGVIQFSVATYKAGKMPKITAQDLKNLLADFAFSRELGRVANLEVCEERLMSCAQNFNQGSQFLRVWYCSNGRDIALVTYISESGLQHRELSDCEKMIRGLEFLSVPSTEGKR